MFMVCWIPADQDVKMAGQTGSHIKDLQALRDKILDLEVIFRKYDICITEVPEAKK